jgi:DMSO/TMAO reductase YedYZ molybdopterin-dependent catalytic subunit
MEETEPPKAPESAEDSPPDSLQAAVQQSAAPAEGVDEVAPPLKEPEEPAEPRPAPPPRATGPRRSLFSEQPEEAIAVPARSLARASRRDFLLFGAGTVAAAAGFWFLMPDPTRQLHLTPRTRDWLDSLEARLGGTREQRERFLNRGLTFDDDVAEALYSPDRAVRTYRKSQITPLRNNYNGQTPGPEYLARWSLTVSGLASGRSERLSIDDLSTRFTRHEQITRLCCVEGWSAVAWWGGLQFADFLGAYPPAPEARWAKLDAAFNLDFQGNPDPYYVSIDLPTARHPQTLLATHWNGAPLPREHGAPLRLVAPMKLGLKNIKAITAITYSREEPADYWAERGYSRYDGL